MDEKKTSDGTPWALGSKIAYLGAVVGVLKRVAGFEESYKRYSAKYTEMARVKDAERKENRMTTSEEKRFVDWPRLQDALKDAAAR